MTIIGKFGSRLARIAAIGSIALAGSCHGWPLDPPPAQTTLAACPAAQTDNTSSLLGVLGGTVSLDGTSVFLPVNALLSATDIELTIPASQYMEIGVTANGGHFLFQLPVTITIDYSRCSPQVQQEKLSVWHINPQTHQLLENMGGVDVKLTHTITFTTDHFSGFAIAY
ncbi:MAG TPA: hypothetical protein VJO33_17240 [Gemmatimonadaceae bacterium]|nr:hypothetical protein [Gemmatimonadaceae bacterium]